ncbi:hypothetical protein SY88_21235 [Clostridiales bacterium PH28_bin88]|nr:hypothetical protein SY88_21235 [Clostridiales bacterium PH28_bin88]
MISYQYKIILLSVVLIITTFFVGCNSNTVSTEEYNALLEKANKLESDKEYLENKLNRIENFLRFPYAIPIRVKISIENSVNTFETMRDAPYQLVFNGTLEAISNLYHLTLNTQLEDYNLEQDAEVNFAMNPYIQLEYRDNGLKIPIGAWDRGLYVKKLIIWHDNKTLNITIQKVDDNYYTYTFQDTTFFTKADLHNTIIRYVTTQGRLGVPSYDGAEKIEMY